VDFVATIVKTSSGDRRMDRFIRAGERRGVAGRVTTFESSSFERKTQHTNISCSVHSDTMYYIYI